MTAKKYQAQLQKIEALSEEKERELEIMNQSNSEITSEIKKQED
jgi:hypothetical protein